MDLFLSTVESRWTLRLWFLTDANWVGTCLSFHLKMERDAVSETLCSFRKRWQANFRNSVIPNTHLKFHICITSLKKNHFAGIMFIRGSTHTDIKSQFFPSFPHSQSMSDLQYQFHSSVHRYVDWYKCNYITKLQMLLLPKIIKMWVCIRWGLTTK